MDSSLSEAFYGVFTSSREIIKNEQTHLYCNMLELLKNTCSTNTLSNAKIPQEDLAKFWLCDILPLVFDKNDKVQKNAIDAFEQYLSIFDVSSWHAFPTWVNVKSTIMNEYLNELHNLRNDQNKYWHKIWCLLVRLFNREILKGAQVINSFLTVVEQGFRSSANKVRTECYSCWHLLIHIFHTNGELTSAKRMKLVCIPLKSSSTRNLYPKLNVVKLHVWWYLLTCLDHKIPDYVSNALEPFINFSLMILELVPSSALWPLLCLTSLVAENMSKELMENSGLEALSMPSPLLESSVLAKNEQLLVKSALKALELGLANTTLEAELKLSLLKQLVLFLLKAMCLSIENFKSIGAELHKSLCKNSVLYEYALEQLGSNSAYVKKVVSALEDLEQGVQTIIEFYKMAKPYVSENCGKNFILTAFKIENLSESEPSWKHLFALCSDLLRLFDKVEDMPLKLHIFHSVSLSLPKIFVSQKTAIAPVHSARLFKWVLWPLDLTQSEVAANVELICAESFVQNWADMWKISLNWPGYKNMSSSSGEQLTEYVFFEESKQAQLFVYFEAYFQAVMETCNERGRREMPEFIMKIVSSAKLEQGVLLKCMDCCMQYIAGMKENELQTYFEPVKDMLSAINKQLLKFQAIKSEAFNWRGKVLEKLRTTLEKQKFAQIKELLKDDVFVIIPSIWTLNPDKLTERQKERFSEKLDVIPELYNDMPASTQQSPMKPWSPRRVVIACNDQTEISLPNVEESSEETPRQDLAILENAAKNEVTTTTPPLTRNRILEQNKEAKSSSPTKNPAKDDGKSAEEQIVESTAASAAILARNECSPKKQIPNFVLTSPPDRKGTNNSRSPILRPKSTNHMTGRGAQLINMIRSRSIDVSRAASPLSSFPLSNKIEFGTPKQSRTLINTTREQTQTTPSMELLIFSKSLPPPSASPSASILKRRIEQRDLEESDCQELPASKRKRVSFHDPPVSVTKEYVRDAIEINRGKRCLDKQLNVTSNIEQKVLRRRNSFTDVEKLSSNARNLDALLSTTSTSQPQSPTKSTTAAVRREIPILRAPIMTPMNALNFALSKLPLDVVLEQCLAAKSVPLKSMRTFTRLVSQCMQNDEVLKTKVLEKISEENSKEILDFAIQENLSAVVCDRLSFNSVIEYVCQKIQVNAGSRNMLLNQMNKVLKGHECFEFIQNTLQDYELTDKQIVDLLSTLVQKRGHIDQHTIEKAPDSSTNL